MIATVSPAASSTEETLSTLRYAKQACSIFNIAKVNEDVNAKLIRGEVDICSLLGFLHLHVCLTYCFISIVTTNNLLCGLTTGQIG